MATALAVIGCRKAVDDPTPGVLAFLADLRHADEDPERARRVISALPPPSRVELEERARRASVVLGRRVDAAELVADAVVVQRFEPTRATADVREDHAIVQLFGPNEAVEHGRVTCVREADSWRVELPLSDTTPPGEGAARPAPPAPP